MEDPVIQDSTIYPTTLKLYQYQERDYFQSNIHDIVIDYHDESSCGDEKIEFF
jgi:hypothetical protein